MNNMSHTLTIIIATYNADKTIERTLDSILMQKTSYDFSILVVDDDSQDTTKNIIEKYQNNFPSKIHYVRHEHNKGNFSARLTAYRLMNSKYHTLLDSDDYWIVEDKIQNALDFLERNEDYTLYMANTYIERGKTREIYIQQESKSFTDFKDYIPGHTSGAFYRTIFSDSDFDKLNAIEFTSDALFFAGETFFNLYHLSKGKAFFENKVESVYSITGQGMWTSLDESEQLHMNIIALYKIQRIFLHKNTDMLIQSMNSLYNTIGNQDFNLNQLVEIYSFVHYCNDVIPKGIDNTYTHEHTRMLRSNNYYFFCPSRLVGGYELSIKGLATFLSDELHFNVSYIDYADGTVAKMLTGSNITIIPFEDDMTKLDIEDNAHFFAPITLVNQIPKINAQNVHFLYWLAHTKSYEFLKYRTQMNDEQTKQVFDKLLETESIVFMDLINVQATHEILERQIYGNYLPVYVDDKEVHAGTKLVDEEINVGWLGRLDSDKIYSVLNILDNLEQVDLNIKKNFHIIGDGNAKDKIVREKYPSVNIIFTSILLGKELEKYVTANMDVLFAHGSSVLEGAIMQMPSFIVPTYEEYNQNDCYYSLYEMRNFVVGFYDKKFHCGAIPLTMKQILEKIYLHEEKEALGKKCKEYVSTHHTLKSSVEKLLLAFLRTKNNQYKIHYSDEICSQVDSAFDFTKDVDCGIAEEKTALTCKLRSKLKSLVYRSVCLLRRGLGINKIYDFNQHAAGALGNGLEHIKNEIIHEFKNDLERIKSETIYELRNGISKINENIYKINLQYNLVSLLGHKVKQKKKARVAFYVVSSVAFSAKNLFESMLDDDLFDPYILVIPDTLRGEEHCFKTLQKTYNDLYSLYGEDVLMSYDYENKSFIDYSDDADLVFLANPYDAMTHMFYTAEYVSQKMLYFYISYAYHGKLKYEKYTVNTEFYNNAWKVFIESPRTFFENKMMNPYLSNMHITGYSKMDSLKNVNIVPRTRKRIIIAPHHTISGNGALNLSNFLKYYDFFLALPGNFPQIDFVFRPHSLLFVNLKSDDVWGIARTEEYLRKLTSYSNVVYDTSADYFDLFINSDGLIHDCGSFLAEYFYTDSPQCYMLGQGTVENEFVDFGKEMLDHCYTAYNEDEIIKFIRHVIIQEADFMQIKRQTFANKDIKYNHPNASQHTLGYIKQFILSAVKNSL